MILDDQSLFKSVPKEALKRLEDADLTMRKAWLIVKRSPSGSWGTSNFSPKVDWIVFDDLSKEIVISMSHGPTTVACWVEIDRSVARSKWNTSIADGYCVCGWSEAAWEENHPTGDQT